MGRENVSLPLLIRNKIIHKFCISNLFLGIVRAPFIIALHPQGAPHYLRNAVINLASPTTFSILDTPVWFVLNCFIEHLSQALQRCLAEK